MNNFFDKLISLFRSKEQIARLQSNAYILNKQAQYKTDFENIESYPLTEEQQKAIIWEKDHVLLIASAGSGKSSTIIAKLYFLLKEGISPEHIFCFAYNTDAALELNSRINSLYQRFHLSGEHIPANTFHAYSMQVIATVTEIKPCISKLASSKKALYDFFHQTTQNLRQTDTQFAQDFNQFILLHEANTAPLDGFTSQREYDGYMRHLNATKVYSKQTHKQEWRLQTLNGLQVASIEERMLVNWLVINGVVFEYEKKYSAETATKEKRQYYPDFYYPEQDVWHEHFAINQNGQAPDIFATGAQDYEKGVKWKRELHQNNQTQFFETTSYHFKSGKVFEILTEQLSSFNIPLNPLPQEKIDALVTKSFNPNKDLDVFMQCLQHCKTNNISLYTLEQSIQQSKNERANVFFRLFKPLYRAYEARLNQEQCIDFDDLLHRAAEYIENEQYPVSLKYILVDEAQDMSSARARLVKAIVDKASCQVFAVGDDWQSIYRFSGADIAIMTNFKEYFGPFEQLVLTNTFRSNQNIADVASDFIQKNPKQLSKAVKAQIQSIKQSVLLADYNVHNETEKLHQFLTGCNNQAKQSGNKRVVFLLSRYNHQRPQYLKEMSTRYTHITINWATIHSSKGLEADYVVVLHVNSGPYGFPQSNTDDPILKYVMPISETYPNAEERRLMYVALTRAKRAVLLIYKDDSPSEFIIELAQHPKVFGFKTSLVGLERTYCPRCVTGQLTEKKGPYGVFTSCSHYPACDYTKALSCPDCGEGKIVKKKTKKGTYFYSCNQYPRCSYTYKG